MTFTSEINRRYHTWTCLWAKCSSHFKL